MFKNIASLSNTQNKILSQIKKLRQSRHKTPIGAQKHPRKQARKQRSKAGRKQRSKAGRKQARKQTRKRQNHSSSSLANKRRYSLSRPRANLSRQRAATPVDRPSTPTLTSNLKFPGPNAKQGRCGSSPRFGESCMNARYPNPRGNVSLSAIAGNIRSRDDDEDVNASFKTPSKHILHTQIAEEEAKEEFYDTAVHFTFTDEKESKSSDSFGVMISTLTGVIDHIADSQVEVEELKSSIDSIVSKWDNFLMSHRIPYPQVQKIAAILTDVYEDLRLDMMTRRINGNKYVPKLEKLIANLTKLKLL